MEYFLGGVFVVWGAFVLYSAIFKLKKYREEHLGASHDPLVDIVLTPIFKVFPPIVAKIFVIVFGVGLIGLGIYII
ncbi:hypothetical protein [Thalassobacillus sp. C254]|uniref:hypothetical protein n=1 Tax=Thalassobacillus sp. C254 TaxID=1225341 RepID=UPI0006D19ED4|nr:hypothetical protein [Thalassobacillus sp. C254]